MIKSEIRELFDKGSGAETVPPEDKEPEVNELDNGSESSVWTGSSGRVDFDFYPAVGKSMKEHLE
ncbi:hypothetical protein GCM10023222_56120 [Saccharopolyspora cebuensis]